MIHRRRICLLMLSLAMLAPSCRATAQEPGTTAAPQAKGNAAFPGWDVISIKPNKSNSNGYSYGTPNDASYSATNVGITLLLAQAYGLREDQVSGLPAWAKNSRWDIQAKNPGLQGKPESKPARTPKQEDAADRAKMRNILQERFHLKAHTESRTGAIYDLVVAKNGPKLTAATVKAGEGSMMWSSIKIESSATPMPQFAELLELTASRNIVDKTGLTGTYAVKLQWSNSTQAMNAGDNSGAFPDLFTALEEQLGLKLVSDKGPVTTLVVDSIAMPTED